MTKTITIIASIVLIVLTFIDINIGLVAILLSMLLSPELEVGALAKRAIIIRAEDLLLVIVLFTWLAKMAIRKDVPVIMKSPLNIPIGLFAAVLCFSTLRGMIIGNVTPVKGAFYVLKLVEYFILYFMVLNHTNSTRQVKLFLTVLLVTSFIVGIYGNTHIGRVGRISAPFEGRGEPNTLGGYLLFILSILGGLILYDKKDRRALLFVFIFLIPTFVFTLSRASYMSIVPALAAFVLLAKQKQITRYVIIIFLSFVLFFTLGPPALRNRVIGTFRPEKSQELKQVGLITLGPSPAARVLSWKEIITRDFPKRPLLGSGMTGGIFVDSQYVRSLQETGIIGLSILLWLLWCVWQTGLKTYNTVKKPLFKGLALGYLVGFVALIVHAVGTNTFMIIRIAEPFWFFTAIIVKLKDIETGKALEEEKAWRSPWR